jgi:hypothetical protein
MTANIKLAFLFWLLPIAGLAQGDLLRMNTMVKNTFIKTEEIDSFLPELKKIVPAKTDSAQQQMLFETYQLAATRYEANNHFKQAYLLYLDYLLLKEKTLASRKANTIEGTKSKFEKRQAEILLTVGGLKNEIQALETNEANLQSRNKSFVRNIGLIIILFSGIFVMVFLRLTWKLKNINGEVKLCQKQLMAMEKTALLGTLKEQLEINSLKRMEVTKKEIGALRELLNQMPTDKNKDQADPLKKLLEGYFKVEENLKPLVKEL